MDFEKKPVAWAWRFTDGRLSSPYKTHNLCACLHRGYEGQPVPLVVQEDGPVQEPVAWEWRWFDSSPHTVTSGQWSEWRRVEPRNVMCTVEDSLKEFRAYIARGQHYELRALYTAPPESAPRQPLTEAQVRGMCAPGATWVVETVLQWVRAIEAAHGIGVPTRLPADDSGGGTHD